MISLRSATNTCTIGGFEIAKNWNVAYSPAANHLMPHLYEDPLRFQPDRFHGTHNGAADNF